MEVIKGYRWRPGCTRGSLVQFSKTFYWNRAFLDLAVNNPTVCFCSPQNNPRFPNFSLLNSTNDWSHSPHHHLFSLDSCWLCSVQWAAPPLVFPLTARLGFRIPFLSSFDQNRSWLLLVGGTCLDKSCRSFLPHPQQCIVSLGKQTWQNSGDPVEQCLKRFWPISRICTDLPHQL